LSARTGEDSLFLLRSQNLIKGNEFQSLSLEVMSLDTVAYYTLWQFLRNKNWTSLTFTPVDSQLLLLSVENLIT